MAPVGRFFLAPLRDSPRTCNGYMWPRLQCWIHQTEAGSVLAAATIHTLATGDWIHTGAPLRLIGDSGTGKSHLLLGLGAAAAEKGYRVKCTLATRLASNDGRRALPPDAQGKTRWPTR
jgi:DNA replication protein DnaC